MMPSAKMPACCRPPPENTVSSAVMPPVGLVGSCFCISSSQAWITVASTPGSVMCTPSRMMTIRARVNRMRSRSSGIFQVLAKAEIITMDGRKRRAGYIHGEEACKRFPTGNQELESRRIRRSGLDGATGFLDLLTGGGADLVHLDGEGLFHFAIAEKFHLIAAAIQQAGLAK